MEEPSVLDYLKSRLFFWRYEKIQIPMEGDLKNGLIPEIDRVELKESEGQGDIRVAPEDKVTRRRFFPTKSGGILVRALLPVFFGLVAQQALEPPGRSILVGLIFYLISIVFLIWGLMRGEWSLAKQNEVNPNHDSLTYRSFGLWLFIPLTVLVFISFGNYQFTWSNIILWTLAFLSFLYAFWLIEPNKPSAVKRLKQKIAVFFSQGIRLSPWDLLIIAVFAVSVFFRIYQLEQVPAEMFSDHAEKLQDVSEVLAGQTRVYFPRNTGREAFQMYLTAAMALIFNTGLSFMSLKLGTVICGILTLPFIYLLGKEVANPRVGLLAMFFAGIAYWPNVISRVALRFTLYPTFTAPMLFFLVRGLRRRNRNDFILSGIFLGLGLNGYSPYRFVPIVVVIAIFLYLLHSQSKGFRKGAFLGLILLALSSFIISIPLLRYAISNPAIFSYRMMTRMGQAERPFPGNPIQIFLENLWKSLIMPVWDNGQIWVHSIPNRPGLSVVAAVFFVIGISLLVFRYMKKRHWLDLFLLISIPLLMTPSVLSLAFPEENPSLNRTGGALIVIFLIIGLAVDSILRTLRSKRLAPGGIWISWVVGAFLLTWSVRQNYDLVFHQYAQQFNNNAWNTSELGAVIEQFADTAGEFDSAWVVPYPHWVDTRLVGIRAGFPEKDYALWPENIPDTVNDPRPKLFLVKPEDTETIDLLQSLYPEGVLRLYRSSVQGRDFYIFTVPPVG